ncbi:MAG: SUMF1/EgtB/PvdO family nonheme iron enzyme [Planctomycetota bacterium]
MKTLRGEGRRGQNRVIRGGSWNDIARNVRAACRNANSPGNRNHNLGFRCARAHARIGRSAQDPATIPSADQACGEQHRPAGALVALPEGATNVCRRGRFARVSRCRP